MRQDAGRLIWSGIRGRNGADSPVALAENECVEAYNVDFFEGALCRKRRGAVALTLTGGPDANVGALISHTVTGEYPQLFAYGNASVFYRLTDAGSTYVWSTPSMVDAGSGTYATGASLNNKCFLCYDTAANRLHVWDGTSIRRVGLTFPSVVTVANTGSGSYAAKERYYRVAWARISGADTIIRSELCPVGVAFTPSGSGTHARVTRPNLPAESETHWLLYASVDNVYSNYKLIATVAKATTTYDDNETPADYVGDPPQIAGLNIPPPSAKFIISDGNRLVMAGSYETTALAGQTAPRNNRVWYTRVLGSSDIGDDESIPNTSAVGTIPAQKNWLDVGENDGGIITGLGIVGGVIVVFKERQSWRLVPTGDDLAPYRATLVSPHVGCISHSSIAAGEGPNGVPALYFTSRTGPFYLTVDSQIQYIGRPIEDVWLPSVSKHLSFAVFHPGKRQYWLYMYGPLLPPFQSGYYTAIYDVVAGGWSLMQTTNTSWRCGVLFGDLSTVMGASQDQSVTLKPTFGGDAVLYKFDDDLATADGPTTFRGYLTTRPMFPAGHGTRVLLHDAALSAEVAAGVTITVTTIRDFGAETKSGTVSLAAEGAETRVVRRVEESGFGQLAAVQYTIGDAAAISNNWVLDALSARVSNQEDFA